MTLWVLAESQLVAQLLMTAGVALLALILILNIRRRGRGRVARPTPPDPVQQVRRQHQMHDDLRRMMVELEELTRRFASQLDTKAVHLEKLLEEADAKIEILRGTLGEPAAAGRVAPGGGENAATGGDGPPPDPKTRQIYRLADAGRDPVEIAREVDEQVGAIELILALRTQG